MNAPVRERLLRKPCSLACESWRSLPTFVTRRHMIALVFGSRIVVKALRLEMRGKRSLKSESTWGGRPELLKKDGEATESKLPNRDTFLTAAAMAAQAALCKAATVTASATVGRTWETTLPAFDSTPLRFALLPVGPSSSWREDAYLRRRSVRRASAPAGVAESLSDLLEWVHKGQGFRLLQS